MLAHHATVMTLALALATGCAEHIGAARSGGFPTVPPPFEFWPPPPATSSWLGHPHGATFGEVAGQTRATLFDAGYRDARWYPIGLGFKHGFAIVTRLEKIETDGTPSADRWSPLYPDATNLRWLDRDGAPRLPSAGRFRIFVVALTDLPAGAEGGRPPPRRNEDTVMEGADLPAMPFPAARPLTARFHVTTFVYEYTSDGADGVGENAPADDRVSAEARARAGRLAAVAE